MMFTAKFMAFATSVVAMGVLTPMAAAARTIEVLSQGVSPCLDTEVSTNIALHLSRNDAREFRVRLQLVGTPSNNLEVAFGTDVNTNGVLEAEEIETVYGWRGGRYVIEDARRWKRYESVPDANTANRVADIQIANDKNLLPKRFSATCGGSAAFAEFAAHPPAWLFRESWDTVRVTRRGVGIPSDWVRCDIEYQFFVIHVR